MSRFWMPALVCAFALTATPTFAKDAKQTADAIKETFGAPKFDPSAMLDLLSKQVKIDGNKIGELTLVEGLQTLAKKHNVTFVIMEEEFKAKKINDIRDKKSRVQKLDTKDMTLAEFLDVWLPSFHATYKIREDYVEVMPLLPKIPEPVAIRLREPKADLKEPKADAKNDKAAAVLQILAQEFEFQPGGNINDIPIFELLQDLSKRHGLTFVIDEDSFKQVGQPNFKEEKPVLATTQLRGITLHQFLTMALNSMGATYLVKSGMIEIVPAQYAAEVTKSALTDQNENGRARLKEPLVSAIFKEKPLNEVVAKLAEMYDLNVIVSQQAGEARVGPISVRLLNVPADKALELLALQADLRVVRKANTFFITSKEQANELLTEKFKKERQAIELEKLRESKSPAPPAPPAPPPPPANPGGNLPPLNLPTGPGK